MNIGLERLRWVSILGCSLIAERVAAPYNISAGVEDDFILPYPHTRLRAEIIVHFHGHHRRHEHPTFPWLDPGAPHVHVP